MKSKILGLGFFVACLGQTLLVAAESNEIFASKFFSMVNQFSREHGFTDVDIDCSGSKFKIAREEDLEFGPCTELWGDHAFVCIDKTGKAYSFFNFKAENGKKLETVEEPKWKPEKAELLTLKFMRRIDNELPNQLFRRNIRFKEDKSASGVSEWNIDFQRRSLDGFLYESDRLNIGISEIKGITTYRLLFFSPAKSFGKPKIEKDQALQFAAEERKRILEWPPAAEHFSNQIVGAEPFQADLRVVNANYLRTKHELMESVQKGYQGDAKLAWVFRYRGTEKNPQPGFALAPTQLDIWVDALTGEIIGGRY